MFLLTFIFIAGIIKLSFAQFGVSYEIRQAIELYNTSKLVSGSTRNTLFEMDYTGSPYLNEEFVNGSIFTLSKTKYEEVPLRYNILNDELEFITPSNEILALATPEIVEKAVLGNTILTFLPYERANKTLKGYFVLLEEGKANLYSKPDVFYKEATPPGAYKDPEPPKFVRKPDGYYIRFETGQALPVTSKKELISMFPDNREKIAGFISKNKIKTNKPEGLIDLVKYYNSL